MSRRLISPIIVESFGVTISSILELEECKKSNDQLYKLIHGTGDAQRLLHAYGADCECKDDLVEDEVKLFTLDHCKDEVYLQGKTYTFKEVSLINRVFFNGYHRQKTVIILKEKLFVDCDLSIRYVTISGMEIIVKSGAKLEIMGCFIDGCKIVCENGGEIIFSDLEISGISSESIRINKGGKITSFKDVRFFDVHKHFYIEYATQESIGEILDLSNADDILDFLKNSTILTIELTSNFEPYKYKNITIHAPLHFINISQYILEFKVESTTANASIKLEGEFISTSKFIVRENCNLSIQLGGINGTVEIVDSDNIEIIRPIFLDCRADFKNSSIRLKDVYIDDNSTLFNIIDCHMKIETININNTNNVFNFSEGVQLGDDDLLAGGITKTNILELYDVTLKNSYNVILGSIEKVAFQKSSIYNSERIINLTHSNIYLEDIRCDEVNLLATLENCNIEANSVSTKGGETVFVFANECYALFKSLQISSWSNFAIYSENSIVETRNSSFKYGKTGIGLYAGSEFRHFECEFTGLTGSHIVGDSNRKIIDLREYVE